MGGEEHRGKKKKKRTTEVKNVGGSWYSYQEMFSLSFHFHFCKTFAAREYLLSSVLYNS